MSNSEHSKVASCCETGLPVCRRMFNMNLALGYSEEFYSLEALCKKHNKDAEDLFELGMDYVQARECFRKEWAKMTDRSECPLPDKCQIEDCFDD